MSEVTKKQYYGAIDGLRAFSALGIVVMHVLANGKYMLSGFIFEQVILSFADLVFLFMIVSGFSVCCGYYHKFMDGTASLGTFYAKRFAKIWPFFAFLCVVDVVLFPSWNSVYEALANLTLCFGLLPNAQISVIGVGWFLGVAFVFYMLFPFVCWLLSDKKRAWLSFAAALMLNWLCNVRFEVGRTSFIYCAVFFLAGGLIFLYKEQLAVFVRKWRWLVFVGVAVMVMGYYLLGNNVLLLLVLFSLMLIYTLDGQGKYHVLDNKPMRFLSSISMEVYLCHMVVFRVIERLGLTHLFASDFLSFLVAFVGTIIGAVVLSIAINKGLELVWKLLRRLTPRGDT